MGRAKLAPIRIFLLSRMKAHTLKHIFLECILDMKRLHFICNTFCNSIRKIIREILFHSILNIIHEEHGVNSLGANSFGIHTDGVVLSMDGKPIQKSPAFARLCFSIVPGR